MLDGTIIALIPSPDQAPLNVDLTYILFQLKQLPSSNLRQSILSSINQIIIYLIQLRCLQVLKSLQM